MIRECGIRSLFLYMLAFFVYQDSLFGDTSSLLTLHLRLYIRYDEVYKTYLSIYNLYNSKISQKKILVKEKKQ